MATQPNPDYIPTGRITNRQAELVDRLMVGVYDRDHQTPAPMGASLEFFNAPSDGEVDGNPPRAAYIPPVEIRPLTHARNQILVAEGDER